MELVLIGGGAVAAVGVSGAAVRGTHKLQNLAGKYARQDHSDQAKVVAELVQRHLSAEGIPAPTTFDLESLTLTSTQLRATTPAYPQLKLAHDAILSYQAQRAVGFKSFRRRVSLLGGQDYVPNDPKTVVCEFMKSWISERIEASDIDTSEVLAYRNLARGLLLYTDLFADTFRQCMGHVGSHLGEILRLRLKESRSADQLLTRLQREVYAFALHSFKVALLTATDFEVPGDLYSLDSLAMLQVTSVPPLMFEASSPFERQLAEKASDGWRTDCGQLGKVLLCTPHMSRLLAMREVSRAQEVVVPISILVERAEGLPSHTSRVDIVDPYVKLEVQRSDKVLTKATTSVKINCPEPVWNERILLEVPRGPLSDSVRGGSGSTPMSPTSPGSRRRRTEDASPRRYSNACMADDFTLILKVKDFCEATSGRVGNTCLAVAELTAAELEKQLAASKPKWLKLPLQLVSSGSMAKLENSILNISVSEPIFKHHVQDLRRRWKEAADRKEEVVNSGLRIPSLGGAFLDSMEALDHFVYFFDIILDQCAGVSRMLGDLGIVAVAPKLEMLIEEAEQRARELEAMASSVIGGADDIHIEAARAKKSVSQTQQERKLQEQARHSQDNLKQLGQRISTTLAELRQVCKRYPGFEDAVDEACGHFSSLFERLENAETGRRSQRFGGAGSKATFVSQGGVGSFAGGGYSEGAGAPAQAYRRHHSAMLELPPGTYLAASGGISPRSTPMSPARSPR